MASRTKQKEEARARRLAEERARAERARRARRLQILGGVVLVAVIIVAVAVAVGTSGGSKTPALNTPGARQASSTVTGLLAGIPQSGNALGSPSAKVTVTEFGDLQCPICKDFALGAENTLIKNDVRSGNVKLVYRSLETATGNSPNPGIFPTQQAAAIAAGLQNHEWDYLLLFYHLQGTEGTSYVNDNFLGGLAKLIPGLNYSKWSSDRTSSALTSQVTADEQSAASKGYNSTPTIVVLGPKGQAQPIVGDTDYGTLEAKIKSVQ
jgi:protein-disulfide isomerase